MKLNLEINNLAKIRLDKKLIRNVILATLKKSRFKFLNNKDIFLSVAAVNKKKVRRLNKIYRHKDKVTDILSFAEYKTAAGLKKEKKGVIFLGELVICPADVRDWSAKNNLNHEKELAKTVSHGVLHLLGFRHGKRMFEIQDNISLDD